MPSFRHFLISFTIFAIFAAAYATPALVHTRKHSVTSQEEIQFRKLLATISDPALHDALEKYISSKYQPAAGHNDATAGTNQIELAKRQSLNSTITTFTTSSETTTPGPTTSDDTTNVPPTSSTSDTSLPGGSPTVTTPSSTSEPTSTPSTNLPTSTTSRSTSTDSSSTDRTTRQSSTTKTAVYTTVRPDGSVSTVTTYTIVPAIETTSDIGPTKTPTLQDAAVRFDGTGFVGYVLIFFVGLVAAL